MTAQRRGVAGHDRAPQGDRRHPWRATGARSPSRSCRNRRRARGMPDSERLDLRRGDRGPARQATPGRRLPLPGRPALRRGRRDPRRHRGRGAQGRVRRHPKRAAGSLDGPAREHHNEPRRRQTSRQNATGMTTSTRPRRGPCADRSLPRHARRWRGCTRPARAAAERDGILDVAYRPSTPRSARCCSPRPKAGLVRVAYAARTTTACWRRSRRRSARASCAPRSGWTQAARQLDEYFAGTRTRFDLPLDFRALARIPPRRARPPGRDRLRAHRKLRAGRAARRQPAGGAGGRLGVRHQSAPRRRALPPGRALRRHGRRTTSAARRPSAPC